ncbi:hypothetical protein E4U57_004412 [Claviceps arundinis]|uniref:Uncharacterized protein n=1 Tax=Claviceps arundinis TaxID=1623583 RepID=A0ABQ7PJK2_9HYPO|nr:hypothetical protein E4U57_004412 [Claviceps arundinis]
MKSKDIYNLLWRRGLTERRVMNQAERTIKVLEDHGFTLQHDIEEDTGRLKNHHFSPPPAQQHPHFARQPLQPPPTAQQQQHLRFTRCTQLTELRRPATALEEIVNVLALHDDTMLALDELFKDARRVASVGKLSHQGFMVLSTALGMSDEGNGISRSVIMNHRLAETEFEGAD